ncbi:hypothetical protein MUGA111182_16855 [Mucilaginibacter galii]
MMHYVVVGLYDSVSSLLEIYLCDKMLYVVLLP